MEEIVPIIGWEGHTQGEKTLRAAWLGNRVGWSVEQTLTARVAHARGGWWSLPSGQFLPCRNVHLLFPFLLILMESQFGK